MAEQTAQVERASHQLLLEHLDVDASRVLIEGKPYVRVERSCATYYTMVGPVVVDRTLYQDAQKRSGPTVDPISLRAGVVEAGWLPQTARAMAHQLQQGTSREALATSEQLCRLPYSRSSFERVGHAVGDL